MRKITIFFILAELSDIFTAIIGLNVGCAELNPFGTIFISKIIATIFVSLILEIKKPNKFDIVIPIIAVIPIPWNLLNIISLFF